MRSEALPVRMQLLLVFVILIIATGLALGRKPVSASDPQPQFTKQQRQLIVAVWSHDLKAAESLLREGLSPNFLFRENATDAFITPLSESIAERQPDMTVLLFNHGAEADFGAKEGASALSVAAWYNDVDTARELLKRGANIEARDVEKDTPLLKAASQSQDLATIKLLIGAGADMKAVSGRTRNNAVMMAAGSLNVGAVKLFIDLGVDPCTHNADGWTAADWANLPIVESKEKDRLAARSEILKLLKSKCRSH